MLRLQSQEFKNFARLKVAYVVSICLLFSTQHDEAFKYVGRSFVTEP